ncbi:MAG: helix-turn-helix transcriptional regulator [Pseudolysinimonas sp.]
MVLSASDSARVLDAVYELGSADSLAALPLLVSRLLYELVPCTRAGWVVIDFAGGLLDGVHWPASTRHLLQQLPSDLAKVPLVHEISGSVNAETLRISDIWSQREWHSKPIYSELYRPNGGEYQIVLPLSFAAPDSTGMSGRRVESLTLIRHDSDFSDRDAAVLGEFGRHVRNAIRQLRGKAAEPTLATATGLGLTARQGQALLALADGSSLRHAAGRLGVAPKTLENHVQAAYARLGVTSRTAALARLSAAAATGFGLGEIPH